MPSFGLELYRNIRREEGILYLRR